MMFQPLLPDLYVIEDTCRVYALRRGDEAILIDFGSGLALGHLDEIGVKRVTDVLITHHHRDQSQGIDRASVHGARIWVPECEREYFQSADALWQSSQVLNAYTGRQERFSPLTSIFGTHLLLDYAHIADLLIPITVLPTPGHTTGSVSFLAEINDNRVIFCGDLFSAPGKLWSLAATQWSYHGGEGLPLTVLSLLDLVDRAPHLLLPSHGEPIRDYQPAVDTTVENISELMRMRRQNPRLFQFIRSPYVELSPHLLRNQTSLATSYVLRSDSGRALLIDYGYDFIGALHTGEGRSTYRPWLYTLPTLKRDWGITHIDAVIPTHYHDDHVAGMNLLRRVEGTQVWAAESITPILQAPSQFDLPCLWYDPIPVDRCLPLEQAIAWQEFTLTLHHLPGHTRYAVAIAVEVDGRRVVFAGDPFRSEDGLLWNYSYRNRVLPEDFLQTAILLKRLRPDVILNGHHESILPDEEYFQNLLSHAADLHKIHHDLLPEETAGKGAERFQVRIEPYQVEVQTGGSWLATLWITNPSDAAVQAEAEMVLPEGWTAVPPRQVLIIPGQDECKMVFEIRLPVGEYFTRARMAADITVNGGRVGQLAECLVTTSPQSSTQPARVTSK